MSLFDPARHEALSGPRWDEAAARATIRAIVDDANRAFTPDGLWPIHPLDVSDERPPDCMKPLYYGAAGVIWALQRLAAVGAGPLAHDFEPTIASLAERGREDLRRHEGMRAYVGAMTEGFLIGETGLHLLAWTAAPSAALADALEVSIGSLVGDTRGLAWGGAGAMLAAAFLHERTGADRWRRLVLAHADALWANWTFACDADCLVWDTPLYGQAGPMLGALHGFAANAIALLRVRAFLPPERSRAIEARVREVLIKTAVREQGEANWPAGARPNTRGGVAFLALQHCIGAPGMVQTLAMLPPDPAVDALLAEAGALIWRAGPVAKLPGLCHGAPGASYAFLRLFERTGDELWLGRARAFAMHAIGQADAALATHGQRKWSVWTGDLGLALSLQSCIDGAAAFPMVDVF